MATRSSTSASNSPARDPHAGVGHLHSPTGIPAWPACRLAHGGHEHLLEPCQVASLDLAVGPIIRCTTAHEGVHDRRDRLEASEPLVQRGPSPHPSPSAVAVRSGPGGHGLGVRSVSPGPHGPGQGVPHLVRIHVGYGEHLRPGMGTAVHAYPSRRHAQGPGEGSTRFLGRGPSDGRGGHPDHDLPAGDLPPRPRPRPNPHLDEHAPRGGPNRLLWPDFAGFPLHASSA